MLFLKNKKGQAIVEALIVIPLLLFIMLGSILFSTFFFDRMVVLYAATNAINEGMGTAPEPGISEAELKRRMEEKGNQVMNYGLFLSNRQVNVQVQFPEDGIAKFQVTSSANFRFSLPFTANLLNNEQISYRMEADYVW